MWMQLGTARNGWMRPGGVCSRVQGRRSRIDWLNVYAGRLSRISLVVESKQRCKMEIGIGRKISIFFVSPGVRLCWQRTSLWTLVQILSICRAELGSRLWWILMWKGLLTSSLSDLFHHHPRLDRGSIEQERHHPLPALYVIDLLYIRHTRLCGSKWCSWICCWHHTKC